MIKIIALTVTLAAACLSSSFAGCEDGKCDMPQPSPTATPAP